MPDCLTDERLAALRQAKVDLLSRLSAINGATKRNDHTEEKAQEYTKEAYREFEERIWRLLQDEVQGPDQRHLAESRLRP